MKSHYDVLGNYIEQVYRTNSDLRYGIDDVRGVSNTKGMMQSRANMIGRTFEKFLVISPGDFVFNRRTTRNGEKIGMAFNDTDRDYIFTEDYVAFKVKDEYQSVLMPEYLYLFFKQSEFDRYARYMSTGSATEFFNWEDMCNVPFSPPSIEFQEKMVRATSALEKRVSILLKINNNLLSSIDTIFMEQFGAYKSIAENYTSTTDLSVLPAGWSISQAADFFDISIGKTPPRDEPEWFSTNPSDNTWISIADMKAPTPFLFDSTEYLTNAAVKKHNVKVAPPNTVLLSFKMTVGRVAIVTSEATTNEAIAHFPCTKENLYFVYSYLKSFNYEALGSTSSITTAINSKIIKNMPFLMPAPEEIAKYNRKVKPLFDKLENIAKELSVLDEFAAMLLPQLLGWA